MDGHLRHLQKRTISLMEYVIQFTLYTWTFWLIYELQSVYLHFFFLLLLKQLGCELIGTPILNVFVFLFQLMAVMCYF